MMEPEQVGTFVELLDAIDQGDPLPRAVVVAGCGHYLPAASRLDGLPRFHDLHLYGLPVLTLPAQTGQGCAYGRCTCCTYPAIEGAVRDLALGMLDAVVQLAEARRAAVSLKDRHNTFELERLAPMASDPRIEITASWPWASVVDWRWRG